MSDQNSNLTLSDGSTDDADAILEFLHGLIDTYRERYPAREGFDPGFALIYSVVRSTVELHVDRPDEFLVTIAEHVKAERERQE